MSKKTKADPTGQATNRHKGARKLQNRLLKAKSQIIKLFRAIPRTRRQQVVIVNESKVVYDYNMTPDQVEALEREIRVIIKDELLETSIDRMPPNWFWKDVVEIPYRQGSAEETVEFNQLVAAAVAAGVLMSGTVNKIDVGQFLRSPEYTDRLERVFTRNFSSIQSLADTTSSQVARQVLDGLNSGSRPSDIVASINERFDVADSSAVRTANTEINKAYNNARMEATVDISKRTGLRAGVLHISALLPTTRAEHGARHGNAYTVAQQTQWWDTGANRINCHCTTQSVLIDNQGKLIDPETRNAVRAERSFFDEN